MDWRGREGDRRQPVLLKLAGHSSIDRTSMPEYANHIWVERFQRVKTNCYLKEYAHASLMPFPNPGCPASYSPLKVTHIQRLGAQIHERACSLQYLSASGQYEQNATESLISMQVRPCWPISCRCISVLCFLPHFPDSSSRLLD